MTTALFQLKIDDEAVARLVADGETDRQIAERFGVHPRTVWRARKRLGLTAPPVIIDTLLADRLEHARRLLEDGLPIAEVARIARVTPPTMKAHLPAEILVPRTGEAASLRLFERKMWKKIEEVWGL